MAQGNYSPLMILTPFALAGLGMLIRAIIVTREWLRFGRVTLNLDPYPGSIGGHVGGQADVRLPYDSKNHFHVELLCQRVRSTGHGGRNANQDIYVVWWVDGLAQASSCAKGTRLRFCFEVPVDLPPSTLESFDYHRWRVVLSARLQGADLNRCFNIPVFPTGQSSRTISFDSTENSRYEEFHLPQAISILRLSRDRDGGVILKYPMFDREKTTAGAVLLAVGLGLSLPGAGMLVGEEKLAGIGLLILGLPLSLASAHLLFRSLIVKYLTVKMNGFRVQATLKVLGIPIGRREAARSDVKYLECRYNIQAIMKTGEAITISPEFGEKKEARQAMKLIADWTEYPVK